MILGTINYMSPEQARGRPTDHRSDQFSFGLILYEMAAGRKAFERPEAVQTMSAIISEEPPPIEHNIPAPLRWVIDRCLAKDPADRYESSRDLFQNCAACGTISPKPYRTPSAGACARRRRLAPLPGSAAAAFMLGVSLAATSFCGGPANDRPVGLPFTPFSFLPGGQCCTYVVAGRQSRGLCGERRGRLPRSFFATSISPPASNSRTAP